MAKDGLTARAKSLWDRLMDRVSKLVDRFWNVALFGAVGVVVGTVLGRVFRRTTVPSQLYLVEEEGTLSYRERVALEDALANAARESGSMGLRWQRIGRFIRRTPAASQGVPNRIVGDESRLGWTERSVVGPAGRVEPE